MIPVNTVSCKVYGLHDTAFIATLPAFYHIRRSLRSRIRNCNVQGFFCTGCTCAVSAAFTRSFSVLYSINFCQGFLFTLTQLVGSLNEALCNSPFYMERMVGCVVEVSSIVRWLCV
jgi:hypothetical protein